MDTHEHEIILEKILTSLIFFRKFVIALQGPLHSEYTSTIVRP
jgi:hypothetical protein